jgi:Secretion system C-terminal sorting domain/Carbohydrate esterase, sialic acid-specific acetylesterase
VRYSIDKLDKNGNVTGTQIASTSLSLSPIIANGGLFSVNILLPVGWYRIKVEQSTGLFGTITTKSVKVGVGEVLFFAGQSNAQGISGVSPPNTGTEYDCISAANQVSQCYCKSVFAFPEFTLLKRGTSSNATTIAPNGFADAWYYEALGKKIVDKEAGKVIPVAFFNVGYGGTGINNWQVSANNPTGTTPNPFGVTNCGFAGQDPTGQPYKGLKTSLNYYGGMLGARGVVWHQGESDALPDVINNTHVGGTRSYYNTALSQVIAKTRQDFNNGLSWAISRASRITINPDQSSTNRPAGLYTNNNVRLAQEDAKNGNSNTQWGAYFSDDITDRIDGTHFSDVGLGKMAEMYSSTGSYAGNSNGGNILGLSQIISQIAPAIVPVFTNNRTTVTLGVEGSYANYCWVKNDAKMDQCQSTASTITMPNTNSSPTENWRCYVTNSSGQTTISQEAVTPLTTVNLSFLARLIAILRAGGVIKFGVNSIETDWALTGMPSWASFDIVSGSDGDREISVTVSNNTSTSPRSSVMQLKSADGTLLEEFTISQKGSDGGTPSCNNGSSPFSITSASYDNSNKCVSYQFNANNLSDANWSISGTSYGAALPQPITLNNGTVNCGVTLPNGTYNFVLTGVSCTGTASGSFTVSGGGTTTTTDRTEGGTASDDGASNPGSEGETNAFDNQSSTKWLVFSPTGNIAYDFANEDAYAINSYKITSANDEPSRDPKSWVLEGSNNNSTWTPVDTRSGQLFGSRFETKTYTPTSTSTAYKQYRLRVTENSGNGLLQIAEIQMFGPAGTGTPPPPPSGGCSFTDGQFLLNWYGETIEAKFCGGVLYARATWGAWKHPNWLIGAGMNSTTAACFANYNPGCGALRIAAEENLEETEENITIFPNPTTSKIKVVFSLMKDENVWFNLYDTQGKNLQLSDFKGKKGRNEVEFDLQNYSSGAYFIDLQYNEKREVRKVMKVN